MAKLQEKKSPSTYGNTDRTQQTKSTPKYHPLMYLYLLILRIVRLLFPSNRSDQTAGMHKAPAHSQGMKSAPTAAQSANPLIHLREQLLQIKRALYIIDHPKEKKDENELHDLLGKLDIPYAKDTTTLQSDLTMKREAIRAKIDLELEVTSTNRQSNPRPH
jgi:uncharacterized protein YdiU (UPF0061 family)